MRASTLLALIVGAAVLAASAIAARGEGLATGDPAAGKRVFVKNCARCHALKAARAKGARAANLDIISPTYKQVFNCVTYGIRGEMPAFGTKRTLTRKQIRDVATFVSRATRPNRPPFPGFTCGP